MGLSHKPWGIIIIALFFLQLKERAKKLYLHYIQRWAKDYLRRRLDWIVDDLYGRTEYASNTNPRHLRSALCPCQVILILFPVEIIRMMKFLKLYKTLLFSNCYNLNF